MSFPKPNSCYSLNLLSQQCSPSQKIATPVFQRIMLALSSNYTQDLSIPLPIICANYSLSSWPLQMSPQCFRFLCPSQSILKSVKTWAISGHNPLLKTLYETHRICVPKFLLGRKGPIPFDLTSPWLCSSHIYWALYTLDMMFAQHLIYCLLCLQCSSLRYLSGFLSHIL